VKICWLRSAEGSRYAIQPSEGFLMIRLSAFVTTFIAISFSVGIADDTKPNASSEELRRLDAFLGKWRVTLNGNTELQTSTSHVEWILGGRFLRDQYTTHDGKQGMILRTFDPESNEFQVWTFTEDGSQYQTGKWSSTEKELKVVGKRGDHKVVTIAAFKNEDTIEWTVGVVDSAGKIVEQYEGVNYRIRDR
jgi:hypothetical protein